MKIDYLSRKKRRLVKKKNKKKKKVEHVLSFVPEQVSGPSQNKRSPSKKKMSYATATHVFFTENRVGTLCWQFLLWKNCCSL